MSMLRQVRLKAVVVGLYALAMLMLGFAPHQVGLVRAADAFLAAYALPDGSVPDLCLTSTGEPEEHGGGTCEACRLTSAPGLVVVADGLAMPAETVLVRRVDAMTGLAIAAPVHGRAHPRGPPTINPFA
jgi:hypothetical protein